MAKTHSPYAPEYRRQMVELVRSGRTPGELARESECSASAIRNWVRQADRDEGRRKDGLTSSDLEELRRLRRDNRQLRKEREILKKGTYIFGLIWDLTELSGHHNMKGDTMECLETIAENPIYGKFDEIVKALVSPIAQRVQFRKIKSSDPPSTGKPPKEREG